MTDWITEVIVEHPQLHRVCLKLDNNTENENTYNYTTFSFDSVFFYSEIIDSIVTLPKQGKMRGGEICLDTNDNFLMPFF